MKWWKNDNIDRIFSPSKIFTWKKILHELLLYYLLWRNWETFLIIIQSIICQIWDNAAASSHDNKDVDNFHQAPFQCCLFWKFSRSFILLRSFRVWKERFYCATTTNPERCHLMRTFSLDRMGWAIWKRPSKHCTFWRDALWLNYCMRCVTSIGVFKVGTTKLSSK